MKQDPGNVVQLCCHLRRLLCFEHPLLSWVSEPPVLLWLLSFLLVWLVYILTLHRIHGRTKILLPDKEQKRSFTGHRGCLPQDGASRCESGVKGSVWAQQIMTVSPEAKHVVILYHRQGEEVDPFSYKQTPKWSLRLLIAKWINADATETI